MMHKMNTTRASSHAAVTNGWRCTLLAMILATGCGADVILAGNFDEWDPDLHDGPIPGDPSGDSVTIYPVPGPGGGTFYPGAAAGGFFFYRDTVCDIGVNCDDVAALRLMHFDAADIDAIDLGRERTFTVFGIAPFQPNTELRMLVYQGHFETVLGLRFERAAFGPTTVVVEHGEGETAVPNLDASTGFNFTVAMDPVTGTFEFLAGGTDETHDLLQPLTSSSMGVVLVYENPVATGSTLRLEGLEMVLLED